MTQVLFHVVVAHTEKALLWQDDNAATAVVHNFACVGGHRHNSPDLKDLLACCADSVEDQVSITIPAVVGFVVRQHQLNIAACGLHWHTSGNCQRCWCFLSVNRVNVSPPCAGAGECDDVCPVLHFE